MNKETKEEIINSIIAVVIIITCFLVLGHLAIELDPNA